MGKTGCLGFFVVGFWGFVCLFVLPEKGKKGRKDISNQRAFSCNTYDLFVSCLFTFLPKFIVSDVNCLMLK